MILPMVLGGWSTPTEPAVVVGNAKYYADGVMDTVSRNQNMPLAGYEGGVSLMARGDIGRAVWILNEGEPMGPFLVIDCEKRSEYRRRLDQGDVIEVSWETAQELGMRGPIQLTVLFDMPKHTWN